MHTNDSPALDKAGQNLLDVFCAEEKLPAAYKLLAQTYFFPLAAETIEEQDGCGSAEYPISGQV